MANTTPDELAFQDGRPVAYTAEEALVEQTLLKRFGAWFGETILQNLGKKG